VTCLSTLRETGSILRPEDAAKLKMDVFRSWDTSSEQRTKGRQAKASPLPQRQVMLSKTTPF
jgi:hypothetical protein